MRVNIRYVFFNGAPKAVAKVRHYEMGRLKPPGSKVINDLATARKQGKFCSRDDLNVFGELDRLQQGLHYAIGVDWIRSQAAAIVTVTGSNCNRKQQ